jgi:hypothetical protein
MRYDQLTQKDIIERIEGLTDHVSDLVRQKQMLQDFILKQRAEHIKQVFKQQIVILF